jgi:hypothetical protein
MVNEPITREEILLNAVSTGEVANFEPITREEMFLAKLGGADVPTPAPITRKEKFLQKAIEGGNSGGTGGSGTGSGGDEWFNDGNTHIWISLQEGRTSPMLGVCPKGTVTVDWGDGSAPDTLTGTSTSTVKWTPNHEYGKAGDYVITLIVDGEVGFSGTGSSDAGAFILRHSSTSDNRNAAYRNAVQKVELADSVTIIGNYAFYYCYSLASVSIPDSVTSIGESAFYYCHSLASVSIPDSVTRIGNGAFQYCRCIAYFDFTSHTAVPALSSTNAFTGIAADCEIRVPVALADEWKAATNWSTYMIAKYIVGV